MKLLPLLLLLSLPLWAQPSVLSNAPIGQLFLTASYVVGSCGDYDPRGYFANTSGPCTGGSGSYSFDPTNVLWSPTEFATFLSSWVSGSLSSEAALSVKPQGVTVWDLEGQEIKQLYSYVGDPSNYGVYSPEMATQCALYSSTLGGNPTCTGTMTFADWMFAQFQQAGYWVGMTLRPQSKTILSSYGGACTYNGADGGNNNPFGYNPNASWPDRGAACQTSNLWATSTTTYGPGLQTSVSESTELSTLETVMSYAWTRWESSNPGGVAFFYIDSTIFWNGSGTPDINDSTWNTLLTYCLGMSGVSSCMLDIELPNTYVAYNYSVPYTSVGGHPEGTPPGIRASFPNARSVLNLAGEFTATPCGPNNINPATLALGYNWSTWVANITAGDIPMFSGWWNSTENKCAAILAHQVSTRQDGNSWGGLN